MRQEVMTIACKKCLGKLLDSGNTEIYFYEGTPIVDIERVARIFGWYAKSGKHLCSRHSGGEKIHLVRQSVSWQDISWESVSKRNDPDRFVKLSKYVILDRCERLPNEKNYLKTREFVWANDAFGPFADMRFGEDRAINKTTLLRKQLFGGFSSWIMPSENMVRSVLEAGDDLVEKFFPLIKYSPWLWVNATGRFGDQHILNLNTGECKKPTYSFRDVPHENPFIWPVSGIESTNRACRMKPIRCHGCYYPLMDAVGNVINFNHSISPGHMGFVATVMGWQFEGEKNLCPNCKEKMGGKLNSSGVVIDFANTRDTSL